MCLSRTESTEAQRHLSNQIISGSVETLPSASWDLVHPRQTETVCDIISRNPTFLFVSMHSTCLPDHDHELLRVGFTMEDQRQNGRVGSEVMWRTATEGCLPVPSCMRGIARRPGIIRFLIFDDLLMKHGISPVVKILEHAMPSSVAATRLSTKIFSMKNRYRPRRYHGKSHQQCGHHPLRGGICRELNYRAK